MKPREIDIVLYHDPCVDGFSAAWVFWRENKDRYAKKKIRFVGYRYTDEVPKFLENKNVMILDFSFKRETLLELRKKAKNLMVLDHHKSAENELKGIDGCIFDMERCGAQIAWDYVYPNKERPWFIEIVADRDLWKWEYEESREFGKALYTEGYFNSWPKLEELLYADMKEKERLYEIGRILITQEDKEVKQYCKGAVDVTMNINEQKYQVKLVSCPPHLRSIVGNTLAELNGVDFAAVWAYDYKLNEWWVNLRCYRERDIDLTQIVKNFDNGGGHSKAARFTIKGGENLHSYFTLRN
jgi:oligoribonuclease NrnB/cAMP/cGMP phosphodiesterase (DHH superfamily)